MGLVCIKGSISFVACKQAHFCEFGKKFGCRSASMQGKVTFPRTMVGHFCEFRENFGGRSASARKSDFYSHHGSSAAEIFPQTSTNGTSESACRIVVS